MNNLGARRKHAAGRGRSRSKRLGIVGLATALVAAANLFSVAQSYPGAGLATSRFEIDNDANVRIDNTGDPAALDWESVFPGARKADSPSGSSDESFGGGTKEDSSDPKVVEGGIPPNKSDLKFFGVHQENTATKKFLHLFWARVQDPSGTTNMDFEFNKMGPPADGTPPARSVNDLLITYDLTNGGTVPVISKRVWTGSQWGPVVPLGATAAGSINAATIPASQSFGLGQLDPRTFGEATIDLTNIFDPNQCESFGSAFLKSRSSDSFTSALKDFVPPAAVNISNCGSVTIVKTDDAGTPLPGATFTLYSDIAPIGGTRGNEDTITAKTCTTALVQGVATCTMANVVQGEYWVVETATPPGYTTAADQHATVASDSQVTLTFENRRPHRVVILVCHEGTATLAPSVVTHGVADKTTVNAVPAALAAKGVTAHDLCDIGGASFGGISGHPLDDPYFVDVGRDSH